MLACASFALKADDTLQGNDITDTCFLSGCPDSEDTNGNGYLDPSEDTNGNGILDEGEDTNGNGYLDLSEDTNGNGDLDTYEDPVYTVDVSVETDKDGNETGFNTNNVCNGTCQLGKIPENAYIPEAINDSKLFYTGSSSLAGGVISITNSYATLDNYLQLNVVHQDASTSSDAVLLYVSENRNGVTINNYNVLAFTVDENGDGTNATGAANLDDDDGGEFDSVIKIEADNVTINNYNDAVINALDKGVAIKILGNGSSINQSGSNSVIKSVDTAILIDNSAIYEAPTNDIVLTDMDNSDFSYNHSIYLSGFFSEITADEGYAIYSLDGSSIDITTTAFTTIQSAQNDAIFIDGVHNFINITNGSTDSLIKASGNHRAIYVYGDDTFENRLDISNPYSSATISAGAETDIDGNAITGLGSIAIESHADEFNLRNSGKITAYDTGIKLGAETNRFTINALSGSEIYVMNALDGSANAGIDILGSTKGGTITLTASSANTSITAEHATDDASYGTAIKVANSDDVVVDISGARGYRAYINGSIIFENGDNIQINLDQYTVINTDKDPTNAGSNTTAIDIENTTNSEINAAGTINGDILLGSNTMLVQGTTTLNGKVHMGADSVLNINGTLKGIDDAIDGSSSVGAIDPTAQINFTCITTCDVNLNLFKDIKQTNFVTGAKVNLYASRDADMRIKDLVFEGKTTLNLYENSSNGNDILTFDNITAQKATLNLYYTELIVNNSLDLNESSSINIYASGNENGKLVVNDGSFVGDGSTRVYIRPTNSQNGIIKYKKDYTVMTVQGGAGKGSDYDFLFQDGLVVYEVHYIDNGSDLDAVLTRKLYSQVLDGNELLESNDLLRENTKNIEEYLDEALMFGDTKGFQNSVINGIDSQATSEDNLVLAINSVNPQDLNFLYIPAEQAFNSAIDSIDNHLKSTMLKSLKDRRWIIGDFSTANFKDSFNKDQKITTLSLTGGYDIIKNKNTRTGVGLSSSFSSTELTFNELDNIKNNMFALSSFIYQSYMPTKFYINTYLLFSMYGYNTERDALYNRINDQKLTANHFRAGAGNVIETGYIFGSLKSKYLNVSVFNELMYNSGLEYDEGNDYNSITIKYDAQKSNYLGARLEFVYLGTIVDINSQEYKLSAGLNGEGAYNLLYEEDYNYTVSFTNDPANPWNVRYYNTKGEVRAKVGTDLNISDGSVTINFGYDFISSGNYVENNFNLKAYKSF